MFSRALSGANRSSVEIEGPQWHQQLNNKSLSRSLFMAFQDSNLVEEGHCCGYNERCKNARRNRWFSYKDNEELPTLANEIRSSFCCEKDFKSEASSYLPTISEIISRRACDALRSCLRDAERCHVQ